MPKGVLFGFFNGVQTTKQQAEKAIRELKALHGTKNAAGEEIDYEIFYNRTDGFKDFVETFGERLKEQGGILQGRYEYFFSAMHSNSNWLDTITKAYPAMGATFLSFLDYINAASIAYLAKLAGNTPSLLSDYAEHRLRIDSTTLEGRKILLVAHSQGNLFVNEAYKYAITKTPVSAVKVVHIAPASPITSGVHTLADLDLVINGLRIVGNVPPVTDAIPNFSTRPANPSGEKDALGHGLLEIYINPNMAIASVVKNNINTALNSLVTPPAKASTGLFTATLTWNGIGDIDLHVNEPKDTHVFYASAIGQAGYLDVDNIQANGPEHYYASCDASKIEEGSYSIAVANYSNADGKAATVQIAAEQGVLGTKTVILGAITGNTPSATMFTVKVKKNITTGNFYVDL
jgi:hypothetical protein